MLSITCIVDPHNTRVTRRIEQRVRWRKLIPSCYFAITGWDKHADRQADRQRKKETDLEL